VLGCVDFELPPSLAGHKDWYDNFFFGVVCKGRHAKLLHRYARSTCLGSSELIYLDLVSLRMLGDEVKHPARVALPNAATNWSLFAFYVQREPGDVGSLTFHAWSSLRS